MNPQWTPNQFRVSYWTFFWKIKIALSKSCRQKPGIWKWTRDSLKIWHAGWKTFLIAVEIETEIFIQKFENSKLNHSQLITKVILPNGIILTSYFRLQKSVTSVPTFEQKVTEMFFSLFGWKNIRPHCTKRFTVPVTILWT